MLTDTTYRERLMGLVRNVGTVDKTIRLVLGVAAAAWGVLMAGIGTTFGLVAAIVGAVLIITGLVNFCPLFKVIGISSNKRTNVVN